MKSFKLYEDYLIQNEKHAHTSAAYKEIVDHARAAVESAKFKADEIIHSEVASGVDKTTEKVAARKAIAKAEEALVYAIEEEAVAIAYMNGKQAELQDADVVQAWLNKYRPAVQAEHLPNIQERVKVGQELLLSALFDYQSLKREYDGITEEIQQLNNTAKNSGRQRDYYSIANPFNEVRATGFNPANLSKLLEDVLRGAPLPAEITHHKEGKQ
ncbi:hypothetical protein ACTL32_18345 [Planococcus sp. FY231025]|uniref:hypothetical protein n=1 Tax=Planococcus sp. FY231025 TaxID=3455699 RepID=UPI003F912015